MRALPLLVVAAVAGRAVAAPTCTAIAPLSDGEMGGGEAARIERALAAAVRELPATTVCEPPPGRPGGARPGFEARPTVRAQALGRELGAARVLVTDAARLGEGAVLYLLAVDVASGRSLASTTAALSGKPFPAAPGELGPEDRAAVRAAVVRVLVPERHVGRLALRIDVEGAKVHVDGHPVVAARPIELPVGTHALRVTHPAYRDFLRFVEIEFDRTLALDVALAAWPRAEGEMAAHGARPAAPAAERPATWRWWVIGAAGVALVALTAGIVWATRPSIDADRSVSFRALPQP